MSFIYVLAWQLDSERSSEEPPATIFSDISIHSTLKRAQNAARRWSKTSIKHTWVQVDETAFEWKTLEMPWRVTRRRINQMVLGD